MAERCCSGYISENNKNTDLKRCTHPSVRASPVAQLGKESACDVGDLGWEDPLEKGKATRSRIPAWRIPCTV